MKCILYSVVAMISVYYNVSVAQDQKIADSLRQIYLRVDLEDTTKFTLLRKLSFNEVSDFNLALSYADELIRLAGKHDNQNYLFLGYFQYGNKKKILGDLDEALAAYLKCVPITKKLGNKSREGSVYGAIADTYSLSGNHQNAMFYYQKAIAILRQANDTVSLASAILNAGDEHLTHGGYDSALMYFTESGALFEKANYLVGKAYNLGNIGMVYASLGKNLLAEENINAAIEILEVLEDYYPICFYLISMSDIYQGKEDLPSALNYAHESLKLAEKYELKQQISDANLKLSELYEKMDSSEKSLKHFKNHIVYRDSVNNLETVQKMADLRTEFEVSLREKEIALLKEHQFLNKIYIMIAIILLIFAIVVLLYFRQRFLNARLLGEKEHKLHLEKIRDLLNTQETKTLQSMVKGQESERKRLARELHNHFGSLMATIKVNLNGIDEKAIPNYHTIYSLVDQACSDIRGMSHALNMGISDDFGLVPALKELTLHLQQADGLEVEFSASMGQEQLGSENEIIIYRIIQELVSNVLKHAEATKLSILLTCFEEDQLINILVQDNGKGFNTSEEGNQENSGMGLNSLKEMIANLDGEIRIDSNPVSGTTVNIDLPIMSTENHH